MLIELVLLFFNQTFWFIFRHTAAWKLLTYVGRCEPRSQGIWDKKVITPRVPRPYWYGLGTCSTKLKTLKKLQAYEGVDRKLAIRRQKMFYSM